MNGHNARFLKNPQVYLSTIAIACYNQGSGLLSPVLNKLGESASATTVNTILEFDLVPQKGNYVNLVVLGAVGSYGATSRRGQPIIGAWMPYLGQIDAPNVNKIGRINLTTVPGHVKFVFSAGLGGCNFVARQEGLYKMLYHEPTAEGWNGTDPNYAGNLLLKAGPAYNDSQGMIGGFGMAMRSGGGWTLLFQLVKGVTVVGVTAHAVP